MPYSAETVPPNVPQKFAKQWAEIWNSSYARAIKAGKSAKDAEDEAFPEANGVIKKESSEAAKNSHKVSAQTAGYLELDRAKKDAECSLVDVPGGVSSELGCCDLFLPVKDATEFECGQCRHVVAK